MCMSEQVEEKRAVAMLVEEFRSKKEAATVDRESGMTSHEADASHPDDVSRPRMHCFKDDVLTCYTCYQAMQVESDVSDDDADQSVKRLRTDEAGTSQFIAHVPVPSQQEVSRWKLD